MKKTDFQMGGGRVEYFSPGFKAFGFSCRGVVCDGTITDVNVDPLQDTDEESFEDL